MKGKCTFKEIQSYEQKYLEPDSNKLKRRIYFKLFYDM